MKREARQVAILLHPETNSPVGKLYLWETGEVDPMWLDGEISNPVVKPMAGESLNWASWKLGRPS